MFSRQLCMGCMNPAREEQICPLCGWDRATSQNLPQHLPAGTILAEKYLVGRVLGQGGFGITYLALDINLGIKMAIKEYYPLELVSRAPGNLGISAHSTKMSDFFRYGLEKFLEGAKTLAQFEDHPNIVSVRSFFRANNTAYLAMNYLEGLNLKEYLDRSGGRLPYQQALKILMPVMDALKAVHGVGVLHRDVSPDNIFITGKGRVVLIDFGAARQAVGDRSRSLSVILKPGFTPEEQYRSRGKQGPYTDLYALAATFYRSLTGQMPPESLDRLYEDTLQPPSRLGIAISNSSEEVLLKAMAVRWENRYRSVQDFQQALLASEPAPEVPAGKTGRTQGGKWAEQLFQHILRGLRSFGQGCRSFWQGLPQRIAASLPKRTGVVQKKGAVKTPAPPHDKVSPVPRALPSGNFSRHSALAALIGSGLGFIIYFWNALNSLQIAGVTNINLYVIFFTVVKDNFLAYLSLPVLFLAVYLYESKAITAKPAFFALGAALINMLQFIFGVVSWLMVIALEYYRFQAAEIFFASVNFFVWPLLLALFFFYYYLYLREETSPMAVQVTGNLLTLTGLAVLVSFSIITFNFDWNLNWNLSGFIACAITILPALPFFLQFNFRPRKIGLENSPESRSL